MSEFKGTKGKWSINTYLYNKGIDTYLPIQSDIKDRTWIAEAKWKHVNKEMSLEEYEANALLISKAPEMLEMLNKIAPILERYGEVEQHKELIQLIKEATEL